MTLDVDKIERQVLSATLAGSGPFIRDLNISEFRQLIAEVRHLRAEVLDLETRLACLETA